MLASGPMGTVLTISPRMPVDRIAQVVRRRVERDGGVELAVTTDDHHQVAHLGRVHKRLATDDRLAFFPFSDTPDGGSYLVVLAADTTVTGWTATGNAKIDAPRST